MHSNLTILDWFIVFVYLSFIFVSGYLLNNKEARLEIADSKGFFLANKTIPSWVATLSVVATAMSGATFLGVPNNSFSGNWTYLASYLGMLLGSFLVAFILIPKYYAQNVTTVYQLLGNKFGNGAKYMSSLMYLIGRFLAGGSRLYMAGLAVSMIIFNDIKYSDVLLSVSFITLLGLAYTWFGGLKAVVWGDVLQLFVFILAVIIIVFQVNAQIPLNFAEVMSTLNEENKLTIFQWDWSFNFWSMSFILTGFTLFSVAVWGMDQDITQRMLSCKNEKAGMKSAWNSVLIQMIVVLPFLLVGSLLYVFYQRPDLMQEAAVKMGSTAFDENQEKIKLTTIMYYTLNELGTGFKGLIAIGVIASAFSTINSSLNSMSSVLVEDLYKPFFQNKSQAHYLKIGRLAMLFVGVVSVIVAILCYVYVTKTDVPLLNFALSMMTFTYAGFLGVFAVALFTNRGNSISVIIALIAGLCIMIWHSYSSDVFWAFLSIAKPNSFMMLFPASFCCFIIASIGKNK